MAETRSILIVGGGIAGATLAIALKRVGSARRYERCRLVVDNSFQLGEWEKMPNMPAANPVAVEGATIKALAQPF